MPRLPVLLLAAGAATLAAASATGVATVEPAGDAGPGPTTTAAPGRALAADQAELRGVVTRVTGTQVAGPVLPLPLTLAVVRGGGTKATFGGGAVAGQTSTIAWDGGRPLPLTGTGGIDLAGPADVEVARAGTVWRLDDAPRRLLPGSYAFGATVAVGRTGIGVPRDGVAYVLRSPGSVTTNGGVTVTLPPAPLALRGPGALVVEGELERRDAAGTSAATAVRFGPGPFELDLVPRPDGRYDITASLLQGPVR